LSLRMENVFVIDVLRRLVLLLRWLLRLIRL
jgi:hypothetical protein